MFLKGCPLKCRWCHNPESISKNPILSYNKHKCLNCGECVTVCPDCHSINNSEHIFSRQKCIACGRCEKVCPGDALVLYGKEVTADEILPALIEDKAFFENSGGGVTLSGGEPLLQADFSAELLEKLKLKDINTAVDTCGFAPRSAFEKVIPFTDIFLFDIKAVDEKVHIKCTGVSNKIILENLYYLSSCNKAMEIRIPFVPGMNDGELPAMGKLLSSIKNIKKVKVLPYHDLAISKYDSLGTPYTLGSCRTPKSAEIDRAVEILRSYNLNAVNGTKG